MSSAKMGNKTELSPQNQHLLEFISIK